MLIGLLVIWGRDMRLARLPAAELIPILEGRLERNARLLGIASTSANTPLEFRTNLINYLAHLAKQRPGLQQVIPQADDITGLVNGFVGLRYSPHPITNDQAKIYLNTWQRLRWRMWGTILFKKTRRIK